MDVTQNTEGLTCDIGYELVTDPDTGHSLRLGVNLEFPEEGINVSLVSFDDNSEMVESLGCVVPLDKIDDLAEYFSKVSLMLKYYQPSDLVLSMKKED